MQRLCGRPGCSDSASVVYGMRPEDLVFWIDVLPEPLDDGAGVLCLRHADSMVVPRGWTLDDLRDPHLHLFRPPRSSTPVRPKARRQPVQRAVVEQLRFEAAPDPHAPAAPAALPNDENHHVDVEPGPWTPAFDDADDLDGLLSAHSPLLSRAFRTADRPADRPH
jgi:hypothetical protein